VPAIYETGNGKHEQKATRLRETAPPQLSATQQCPNRMNDATNANDQEHDLPNFPDDDYNPLLLTAQVLEFLMSESAGTEK
jgi:hypothetical protein